MLHTTLICPQCGAPLPRQAAWRMVTCTYCGVDVTRNENFVRAAAFHEAYERAYGPSIEHLSTLRCQGHRYRVLTQLGYGSTAKIVLAQRIGPLPERVVIKLAHSSAAPDRLKREYQNLQRLQANQSIGSAYFSQRLPQPIAFGTAEELGGNRREALVLRNQPGFWGSLAEVRRNYPGGIDPRHAVWMWRRVLEVLGYIHQIGWAHGHLAPEHLLVHPEDHGILIIGWADAQQLAGSSGSTPSFSRPGPGRDLAQSAWTIRALLAGGDDEPKIPASIPPALTRLLKNASEDIHWCTKLGAAGLDQALKTAAREAFGPPQFVHFTPTPHA
ncbi:MAG: protein kinase family protein [Burkholderiales bacterium]|nr:protein kinase family protein [Burkholderiales bacterium]